MPQKSSHFFNKTSIKPEPSEDRIEESLDEDGNFSSNTSQQLNNGNIINNVKFEPEQDMLIVLPRQKILIKAEKNELKNDERQCKICLKYFATKYNVRKHEKIHVENRPKPLKCSKCDYATDDKYVFRHHLEYHERTVKKCEKCNKILKYRNSFHECRLDCKFCGKKFSRVCNVNKHIKNAHAELSNKEYFECDFCGLKHTFKVTLLKHIKAKHLDGKIETFTCDLDAKVFEKKIHISNHMKTHLPAVKCKICNREVRFLSHHIKFNHTHPERSQCRICLKFISSKAFFDIHMKNHNKSIKCKICNKLFGTNMTLKQHTREVHDLKQISCNVCDKKFSRLYNLKIHQKVHNPNRRRDLKCTQCNFTTDNKGSFRHHLKSHKNKVARIAAIKNPHKCPQCPSILKNLLTLKSHIYNSHPEDLLECDICGKQRNRKYDMMLHFRNYHKIKLG